MSSQMDVINGETYVYVALSVLNELERKARDYDLIAARAARAILQATDHAVWQRMANDNRKVDAIKYVRRITGLGLKESKDVVDRWCSTGVVLLP